MDRGTWWTEVHGVTKRLAQLSDYVCTHTFGTQLTVLSSPVHLHNSTVRPAAPEIPDCP